MGEQDNQKPKKHICTGLLAHVDAGKTTLTEGILYTGGIIRKLGRVDNRDAFFDTFELERARGITIFSKLASVQLTQTKMLILDTPGHVDFSMEMERTLQVLDYAILVISAADGVQGHTMTLWRLLDRYQIPVFLFVNKMDQNDADANEVMKHIHTQLSENCVDFRETSTEAFYENLAVCDEILLDRYMESGTVPVDLITDMIAHRKVFPCFFGSALKLIGIQELMLGIDTYTKAKVYPKEFGARIYKITRDEQGNRLTHMKITGGSLVVRTLLSNGTVGEEGWEEKATQIRCYSGEKYESVTQVEAGDLCAVTGLTRTKAGEGLGIELQKISPAIEPVLTYQIILPSGCDVRKFLPQLKQLEEENPELHIIWDEQLQEIQAQVMGQVQIEILKSLILNRYGIEVEFGAGSIVYKETITNIVEGVGHFEPLRHYAEVHLRMEPLPIGSGLVISTECSEDMLDKNWQRLVLTHLQEIEHRGVMIGSVITDMKITLVAGRAHIKHTEGGDFRQATYRAVRQGLMQAESLLLEPYYSFWIEVPETAVGRTVSDLQRMYAKFTTPKSQNGLSVVTGEAPVVALRDYPMELAAYTKGMGRIFLDLKGYGPCHNTEEVLQVCGYDPLHDIAHSADSVFCAHGSGFIVPWNEVFQYMHLENQVNPQKKQSEVKQAEARSENIQSEWMDVEEIDSIINRTFYANKREEATRKYGISRRKALDLVPSAQRRRETPRKPEYLLVDGYNIIFAWKELSELAAQNIDSARGKLMDILCNYQAVRGCSLLLVFDAYRVSRHRTETVPYHNIQVIYTAEAETADQYIEKFTHKNSSDFDVTVATSDGLEQIIIRGQGGKLLSARDLKKEVDRMQETLAEQMDKIQEGGKHYLLDGWNDEAAGHGNRIINIEDEKSR